MKKVTSEKPNTHTKTRRASVQTYIGKDGKITVTTGYCGGSGKGKPGGRYGGKQIVG